MKGPDMTRSRIFALVAFVLMAAALAAAHAWRPATHMADSRAKLDLEKVFPGEFGDWKMDTAIPVQLISPDVQRLLASIYNQTLTRTYINTKGERIMLSVAYGGDQSDATRAHRPEVCYPAQGFQIIAEQTGFVDTATRRLPVQQLVAKAGGRIEPISYWVTVGDHTALSGTQQKLAQLRYTTRGIVPDGMLVRVSNINPNYAPSFALHSQFIRQMSSKIPQASLARVIGSGGA